MRLMVGHDLHPEACAAAGNRRIFNEVGDSSEVGEFAGGYAGSPQICQDNVIDVKLNANAPALKLRAVRTIN